MGTPEVPENMQRVIVVGTTGSGKSTLAAALSQALQTKHIELDAHRFLANWQVRDDDDFRARVDAETQDGPWVCCGNYSVLRDVIWPRADTLVFLDLPMPLLFWRITKRSLQRAITRENLWGSGNRENFIQHLQWNETSLYFWASKTHKRRKREIPILIRQPEFSHLRLVHLTTVRQVRQWQQKVQEASRK